MSHGDRGRALGALCPIPAGGQPPRTSFCHLPICVRYLDSFDPSSRTYFPSPQILKTVAQLTAGLDLAKDDDGAAGPGDIIEAEHPSILPNRPNYKLYHTALPK